MEDRSSPSRSRSGLSCALSSSCTVSRRRHAETGYTEESSGRCTRLNNAGPALIEVARHPCGGTVPGTDGKRPIRAYLRQGSALCPIDTAESCRTAHGVANPGTPISTTGGGLMVIVYDDLAHRAEDLGSADGSPRADSRVSVIVVAAERLFRLGVARLLGEDERLDVIGVSEGEPELVDLCAARSVDVVLIDMDLTKADSIELVRLLASECPFTKTLIVTSQADWGVRPAMIAGAAGILLKDTSPESIRAAVISVHLGDQVLCNEAARWVLGEEYSTHLTQRETDVLRMVAQGANNAEIAAQLHLGQKTVRNYVSRIYQKLELTKRAQIATYLAAHRGRSWLPICPTGRPADDDFQVRGA